MSRMGYALAYMKDGYDNKYEREAKTWVEKNIQTYIDCLSDQK